MKTFKEASLEISQEFPQASFMKEEFELVALAKLGLELLKMMNSDEYGDARWIYFREFEKLKDKNRR